MKPSSPYNPIQSDTGNDCLGQEAVQKGAVNRQVVDSLRQLRLGSEEEAEHTFP